MRIIDQNGCDYPYESIAISYGDGIIYARPISNMDKRYLLARYSTQEKAEKAMQKLYDDYDLSKRFEALGYKAIQNLISWNGRKETEKFLYENIFSFRFPQDDEF